MLNQCQFIGNVGKEIEYRSTQSGDKVANFSLAVSEKFKDRNGERQEKTTWINVVCFSKGLVGVLESYVGKGDKLFISGKLENSSWETDSGEKRYKTDIIIGFDGKIIMLGSKQDKQQSGYSPQTPDPEVDVPF